RNPRKTNWEFVIGEIERELGDVGHIDTVGDLNDKVNKLSEVIIAAFEKGCKLPKSKLKKQPIWWTGDIENAMKEVRRLKKREQERKQMPCSEQGNLRN
ncbi:hypothetical protein, partial [Streptomyces sp. IBSBF 2390]|uniref:hypothetical protein n=1 Tax=Streptomyces sp. IBSBF 2390 TaxID=2903533 RepID=UPI002FDC6928